MTGHDGTEPRELALNGGPPVRTAPLPAWPPVTDAARDALLSVLESGTWGGFPHPGPATRRYEQAFAAFQRAPHAILTTSGSVALEVALRALGIGEGDEVLVPAWTFSATATAVVNVGAVPVLVDVEHDVPVLSPAACEAALTERTRCVVPVHLGQHMADMTALCSFADGHGLLVLEDCAHAFGKSWNGVGAGLLGDAGAFSHEMSKSLSAGEGGTVVSKHREVADRCRSIIDCGRSKGARGVQTAGSNLRATEFVAALLKANLALLPEQIEQRQAGVLAFERLMSGRRIPFTAAPVYPEANGGSLWKYIIRFDPVHFHDLGPVDIATALEAEGIPAWEGYPTLDRYQLFRPELGLTSAHRETAALLRSRPARVPNAHEHARSSVFLHERVFRAVDSNGPENLVEALIKIAENVDSLRRARRPEALLAE